MLEIFKNYNRYIITIIKKSIREKISFALIKLTPEYE